MRGGRIVPRRRYRRPISESGSSSWPTATSKDAASSGGRNSETNAAHPGTSLTDAVGLWATPVTSDQKGAREFDGKRAVGLNTEVALWATPTASVPNDGESPETFERRRLKLAEKHQNGNGVGTPLAIQAKMWASPSATDWKGSSRPEQRRRQLSTAEHWPTPTTAPEADNRGSNAVHVPKSLGEAASLCRGHLDPATSTDGAASSRSTAVLRPRLNPTFVLWMMGLPRRWLDVE